MTTSVQNSLMNEYQPHPLLQQAVDVYLRYYERTETFDAFHCQARSPRTGHAIPTTSEEFRICGQNAREQIKFAERELDVLGVPREVRKEAQRIALDLHERGAGGSNGR